MQTEKNKRGRPRKWNPAYLKNLSEMFPEHGKRHISNYAYALSAWRDIHNTKYEMAFCDKAKKRIKVSLLCELGKVENKEMRDFFIQWIYESSLKEKFNVRKTVAVVRYLCKNPDSINNIIGNGFQK